ncbi:MAG: transglycosylase domain-containing protein, partial [Acidobacteriota bacterium]
MKRELRQIFDWITEYRRQVLLGIGAALLVVVLIAIAQLITMYSHYAGIVEARLSDRSLFYPSGIYAAPRRISVGEHITSEGLVERLLRAGYREAEQLDDFALGSFSVFPDSVQLHTNEFAGSDQLPSRVTVRFVRDVVGGMESGATHEKLTAIDLPAEMLTADIESRVQTRRATAFDDLPPMLVKALTAIEDRRFFNHRGVDPRAMLRALWTNLSSGRIREGGSTITQQLIKNQFLTPERTYTRKLAEAMMAVALERRLSKKQIFALYCERVYLGHSGQTSIYGFKQAARVYFGKDLRDLSLSEMATLAGAGRAPNRYSLHSGLQEAMERRNLVLKAMTETGVVSSAEATLARGEALAVLPPQRIDGSGAPHFVDYVKRELSRQSFAEDDWPQMRIETTLDP